MKLLDSRIVGVLVGHKECPLGSAPVGVQPLGVEELVVHVDVVPVDGAVEGDGDHHGQVRHLQLVCGDTCR